MKKIFCLATLLTISTSLPVLAETENTNNNANKFFIEIGTDLFGTQTAKYSVDNKEVDEMTEEYFYLNKTGNITFGTEFYNGMQLSVTPGHQTSEYGDTNITNTSLSVQFDIVFMNDLNWIKPFIFGGVSCNVFEIEYEDGVTLEDTSLGYSLGAGIKMDITENVYSKIFVKYKNETFKDSLYDVKVELDNSTISLGASIGYRF